MDIEDRVAVVEEGFDLLEAEVYRLGEAFEGRIRGDMWLPPGTLRRAALRFEGILRRMHTYRQRGGTPEEYVAHHTRRERDMR